MTTRPWHFALLAAALGVGLGCGAGPTPTADGGVDGGAPPGDSDAGATDAGQVDACLGSTQLTAAQLCPDRERLGFGQEFGSGTYLGTRPQDTLSIRNEGLKNLEVSSVALTGDSAFTLTVQPAVPATIASHQVLQLRVEFAPTEARLYQATITVQSNAANGPTRQFAVSGCGVPTDGGASPCYPRLPDGGTP